MQQRMFEYLKTALEGVNGTDATDVAEVLVTTDAEPRGMMAKAIDVALKNVAVGAPGGLPCSPAIHLQRGWRQAHTRARVLRTSDSALSCACPRSGRRNRVPCFAAHYQTRPDDCYGHSASSSLAIGKAPLPRSCPLVGITL